MKITKGNYWNKFFKGSLSRGNRVISYESLKEEGIKSLQNSNWKSAIKSFRKAMKLNPNDTDNLVGLATAYTEKGGPLSTFFAARYYQRALDKGDERFETWLGYGTLAYKSHHFNDALRFFNEAFNSATIDEEKFKSLQGIGLAYYSLGSNSEARKYWEEALKIKPNDPEVLGYFNLEGFE